MDIKAYWNKVEEVAKRLSDEVWLMSMDNTDKGTHAGTVSVAPRDIAACRLVEQTHRIATDAEVAAHKDMEATRLEKQRQREVRRDPRRVILQDANFGAPAAAGRTK